MLILHYVCFLIYLRVKLYNFIEWVKSKIKERYGFEKMIIKQKNTFCIELFIIIPTMKIIIGKTYSNILNTIFYGNN